MSANALKDRLRTDLKAAMRERRAAEVSVLRTLIAAVDNAEAVPLDGFEERIRLGESIGEVGRRELDSAAIDQVLASEAQSRIAAAEDHQRNGRTDDAARLRGEADLIARYRA